MKSWVAVGLALFAITSSGHVIADGEVHLANGIAMHGQPQYGADFDHFNFVNLNAPRDGEIKLSGLGTFDTLNPYILKGNVADGANYLYDTLLVSSPDEPFTEYGLIAEKVEWPEDRSWVIFHINPKAKFSDGQSITADDVKYSFHTLVDKGHPRFALYYADVKAVDVLDKQRVKFTFANANNREMPLIMGQLAILPKHYWEKHKFDDANLDVPVTSGAYTVSHVEGGRSLTYSRLENYWAKDLPVNKGRYNFKKITLEYFRDNTVALEAFKSGQYDFRSEYASKNWNTAYVGPNFENGSIKKELIRNYSPQGMQGFAMNTRRDIFKDPRVRQAIAYALDFEWTNKSMFYSNYIRSESYYANSELAATGLPSPEELALLKPFEAQLPPEVFTKPYEAPKTDGSGNIRANLRTAMELLKQAGWQIKDKKLVNAEGKAFSFEFLTQAASPEFERIILPFVKNLSLMGIEVTLRAVDTPQYKERSDAFDFDMMVFSIPQSNSPGNEQRNFFGSASGKQKGGGNYMGIDSPAVDALAAKIVAAKTREELVTACRALDRVLLWGHYVVPNWHYPFYRVAYWKKMHHPETLPKYALDLDSWWVE